jgi:hypothetical protein
MTPATTPRRAGRASVSLALALLMTAACTTDPAPTSTGEPSPRPPANPQLRLVAFSSCDDAVAGLRNAAKRVVGPWGLDHGYGEPQAFAAEGARTAIGAGAAPAVPDAAGKANAPDAYSGTNTHEVGVDEPDLVKTDGRRIVTVSRGRLRVVDAQRRVVTGTLDLARDELDPVRLPVTELLLSGDRALVFVDIADYATDGRRAAGADVVPPTGPRPVFGPSLLLVDLAGQPRLLGEYRFDGQLVDARQTGTVARIVLRSRPRLEFPQPQTKPDLRSPRREEAARIAANRRVIDRAGTDQWLPRYEVTRDGRRTTHLVPCDRLSRPTAYSATSMLTVLTFDLTGADLGDGDPLTVVADGDTVYGTGDSLYVASDMRRQWVADKPASRAAPPPSTTIYRFDTSGSGRPRFEAAGDVPGWLINQYAMSEWDGRLRIATTVDDFTSNRPSQSGVYVLRQRDDRLVEEGRVTGLGRGERIYAVRYVGSTAYVVTFRQVDPLYAVDLSEPARPRVTGELKITGYSAYLHPAGDGRLIGVGQEASTDGRIQGMQVSLFDVSDAERPRRLAQRHIRGGYSTAEFDPHAFLYWPADRLLVLPMSGYGGPERGGPPAHGALVLRVDDRGFTEIGIVRQAARDGQLHRSLVIGDTLWTLSDDGLRAMDSSTLDDVARVRL